MSRAELKRDAGHGYEIRVAEAAGLGTLRGQTGEMRLHMRFTTCALGRCIG
jgi:hypothetical protein